jgi:2-haloacid dehalogenase
LIQMFKAISFDCYGTLIDWESGIKSFLAQTFRDKGVGASVSEVFQAREEIEFDMIQARYRRYSEVLHQSLREAFTRYRVPYAHSDGDRLVESVPNWPLFSETKPALEDLAEKHRLGIISNIDNEIIRKTKAVIGVKFDLTVTAQFAKAYKPSIRPFQVALRRFGYKPEEILHVSSGFRYDIPPAHELGIKTAWVNRKNEPKPKTSLHGPDYEFTSLTELAERMKTM